MAQWRIKEISDLTGVSVRTLHHYDQTGLLKPSVRTSNGYRWYSEKNLATLQQIIALKSFGFSLGQIKTMLQRKPQLIDHLHAQRQVVSEQLDHLRRTRDTLDAVIQRSEASGSLMWNDVIALIKRYDMTEKIDKWLSRLTEQEKARYFSLKEACPAELNAWEELLGAINNGQLGDPEGPDGERAVKTFQDYMRAVQTWEKTQPQKKVTQADADRHRQRVEESKADGFPFGPEGSKWFVRANCAQRLRSWQQLHQGITENIDADPAGPVGKKFATQWREIINQHTFAHPEQQHTVGEGTKDLHFGTMLLMETARTKCELEGAKTTNEIIATIPGTEILRDLIALSWIEKALQAH